MTSQETYVAALRWFGWKDAKARQIVAGHANSGTLDQLDRFVRQYKTNTK